MGLKVNMYDTGFTSIIIIIAGFTSPDPSILVYNNLTPEDQFTVKVFC